MSAEQKKTKGHRHFIDYLRVLGCVFVVMQHLWAYQAERFLNLPGSGYFNALTHCGVPIFFCIVGYVLMMNYSTRDIEYGSFIRKRFRRLLLPYFSVSILVILSRIATERFQLVPLSVVEYTPLVLGRIISDLLFAGASMHLYFLPSIFLMYAVFPFIRKPLASFRFSLVGTLVYILAGRPLLLKAYAFTGLHLPDPDIIIHTLWGFQYFLLGCIVFHVEKKSDFFQGKIGIACFVSGMALTLMMHRHFPGIGGHFLAVASYVCLAKSMGGFGAGVISKLGGLTYGVYLFHLPYFVKVADLLLRRFDALSWTLFLSSTILIVIGASVLVVLLRKIHISRLLLLGEE